MKEQHSNENILYDDDSRLSPIDIAKIMKVARTTVNYWIRNYGLKAEQTPGGRYKVRYGDLKVFLSFHHRDNRKRIKRQASKYKIAVIEPAKHMRENYVNWLSDVYDVRSVSDTSNPMKEVLRISPDIIIMEAELSDTNTADGFLVLEEMRRQISLSSTLILFVTKTYNEADVVRGLDGGACDYIKKPIGQNELRARLKNAMRSILDFKQTK